MLVHPSVVLYDATGGWLSISIDAAPRTQVGAIVR